jgi:site-specific DNA recombinase
MIADTTQVSLPFEAIIVHSRSRFFRDLFQFLRYERQLKKAGVKLLSITQQTSDDPAGEMASKLFSLFDEYASQENAKHTLRAMKENARQGYWNGSHAPFGYRAVEVGTAGARGRKKRRLEVDPAEAETVHRIFELYLHGYRGRELGMKGVAAHLNERGISMRGRLWRSQKINEVLSDPVYVGIFYFNQKDSRTNKLKPQTEWIAVEVPAIVAPHVFERVKQRREACNPKMMPPRAVSSPAPLVGLLTCGQCGAGMAQASGKSGRYRYYKCTTRLNKNVHGCASRNLPRDSTDTLVLSTLAERVFTPARVKLMLEALVKRQRAARTVEDTKLVALKRELDKVANGQTRLFEAVEKDLLPMDDSLRVRAQRLKARREEILLEIAKLDDRRRLSLQKVSPVKVDAFCRALKKRLTDPASGLGKAYLRLVVDEIRLEGDELRIRGSYRRLADAMGLMEKMKLGEVPSFIPEWRARTPKACRDASLSRFERCYAGAVARTHNVDTAYPFRGDGAKSWGVSTIEQPRSSTNAARRILTS